MSMALINTPLNLACTAGTAEFIFKVLNVARVDRKWGKIGQQVDIWIDYPQAVAAGFAAWSFFGRGVAGYTAAAACMITPLALKIRREFYFSNLRDFNDHRDANMREAEVMLGHAIKVVNICAAACAIWSQPPSSTRLHLGQAVALTLFLSARIWQCSKTGY
ncbi:MAG: hypothetical protein JSS10_02415 [Verrucomicrobia bacterium]|nr:hypothetical protein [Verrucomicrobiota bacterium]